MSGEQSFSEDPGIGEQIACWAEPGSQWCADYREARYAREQAALQQQAALYELGEEAAAAAQGYQQAQSQATTGQYLSTIITVAPFILISVGAIGAFFWWRNKKLQEEDYYAG